MPPQAHQGPQGKLARGLDHSSGDVHTGHMTTTRQHSSPMSASHRRLISKIGKVSFAEANKGNATPIDFSSTVPAGAFDALVITALNEYGYTFEIGAPDVAGSDGVTDNEHFTIRLPHRIVDHPAMGVDVFTHELAHAIQWRTGFTASVANSLPPFLPGGLVSAVLEVQAEAVADGVTSWLGIDHSDAHAQYIANWAQMLDAFGANTARDVITFDYTKTTTNAIILSLTERGVKPL